MTQHPLARLAAALLGGVVGTTVRLLPDPIDVTFIPAVAGFSAGLFVAIALLTGRDPNRAAVYGVRWGALVGTVLFVVALIAK